MAGEDEPCALRSMRARSIGSASTVALEPATRHKAPIRISCASAARTRPSSLPGSNRRLPEIDRICGRRVYDATGRIEHSIARAALPGRRREVSRRSLSAPHARRAALPGAVGRACRRRRSCWPVRMRATPGLGALAGFGVAARSSAVARTAARQRISSLRRSSSSDRCCPDATYRTRGRAYADFVRSGGYGFLDVHRAGERRRARRICATNVLDRVPD